MNCGSVLLNEGWCAALMLVSVCCAWPWNSGRWSDRCGKPVIRTTAPVCSLSQSRQRFPGCDKSQSSNALRSNACCIAPLRLLIALNSLRLTLQDYGLMFMQVSNCVTLCRCQEYNVIEKYSKFYLKFTPCFKSTEAWNLKLFVLFRLCKFSLKLKSTQPVFLQ